MKLLLCILLLVLACHAQSVTLAWNPSPGASGYTVTESNVSSTMVTNCSATVSNLLPGVTNSFTVSAFDDAGDVSPPSNPVSYAMLWPTNGVFVYQAAIVTGPWKLLDWQPSLTTLIGYATHPGFYAASNSTGWIHNTNGVNGTPPNFTPSPILPPMPVMPVKPQPK